MYLKLQTGDIVCFKRKFKIWNPMSWLSLIIRIITRVEYNHVGTVGKLYRKFMLFEALGPGVVINKAIRRIEDTKYTDKYRVLRRKSHVNNVQLVEEALELCGHTKYDIIGLIYQLILNLTGIWVGPNRMRAKRRMYCYELVYYLHRDVEAFKFWNKLKPKELFKSEEFEIVYESE